MEVKMGLYKTIEKMYPDLETRIKLDQQLEKFKRAEGLFGMSMAILTREKKQPGPRNLKLDRKGKGKVLADEEEVEELEVLDDEDATIEEEEQEDIMVEDDDEDDDEGFGYE
ncbi:hypothetical protein J5N97_011983 [Dioscorea zingiberensis]|uniref:Uncharacterized protein n=1 Tax=Dioscorea zingiberensis TaxID=325984 RepID=A0A9D5D263_9LILI|nr:hypothetical protein J5N97_011983 [Dioscorea zingiberensis]